MNLGETGVVFDQAGLTASRTWQKPWRGRASEFVVPTWEAVLVGLRPGQNEDDQNPVEPKHRWQKLTARAVHQHKSSGPI